MPLCEKDKLVLDSIFNPLQLGGGAEFDSWMVTEDATDTSSAEAAVELSDAQKKALKLETEAILAAEQKQYQHSIELFSQAIELHPDRPNTFNNRAQAYRLCGQEDLAVADLTKALQLCDSKGAVAKNAFCQRGLLYRKTDEDAAREDFKQAARLGSSFARNQLVELNPYAALCNQMLQEAFLKMS